MEPGRFQRVLSRMAKEDSQSDVIWDSALGLAQANVLASNPETRAEGIAKLIDLSNRFPDSSNVCALVAQALAWDERQDEAIAFIRDRFPEYLSEELTGEQAESSDRDECPVCGHFPDRHWVKEISYACPFCGTAVAVDESVIPPGGGVNVLCRGCRKSLHLPSQIWCPQCHRGLVDRVQILRYIAQDNDVGLDLLNREGRPAKMSDAELDRYIQRGLKINLFGPSEPETDADAPRPMPAQRAAPTASTQAPNSTDAEQRPSLYKRVRWKVWLVGMALVLILTIVAVARKSDSPFACAASGWLAGILVAAVWGIESLRKR